MGSLSMPKVSVVIPSFNSQKTIIEAIESVLIQTHANLEVIFVDDGSSDQTIEVLKSINDPRFQWVSQKNMGCAAARNHGVRLATGELLCFLDADDLWAKNKIEKQLVDIQSKQIVFTNVQEFVDPGIQYSADPKIRPGYYASTMLIARSDFLRVGMFDEGLAVAEFIDWLSRAQHLGLATFLNQEVLAYRRIHAGNVGRLNKPNANHYAIAMKAAIDRKRNQAK